jgi:cytidylate kinase
MSDRIDTSLPSSIEHRLEAMLRISQSIREKGAPAGAKPIPFITISRQYGCAAQDLAELLALRLAELEGVKPDIWQIYSRRLVEEMAQKLELPAHVIEELDRTARGGMVEFFEMLMGHSAPDLRILRQLVNTVRAVAVLGHAIIIGRGGAILTASLPGGLHVRLIAPEPWRQHNLVERFGWNEEKARLFLHEEEQHRRTFFMKYLGQDGNDPAHYDLILNAARVSREEQVEAIAALFRRRFHA